MNSIRIGIFGSSTNFTKLYFDLDNDKVFLNGNNISMLHSDFVATISQILSITKEWKNTKMIDVNSDSDIVVEIKDGYINKEYRFRGEVPINMYKIYDLIDGIKNIIEDV